MDYYESRRAFWCIFKEKHLEEYCRIFRELYSELKDKWRRKADSDINFRIDWYKIVMELGEHFSGENIEKRLVTTTMAKYGLNFT